MIETSQKRNEMILRRPYIDSPGYKYVKLFLLRAANYSQRTKTLRYLSFRENARGNMAVSSHYHEHVRGGVNKSA